jgi:hypothetical protein
MMKQTRDPVQVRAYRLVARLLAEKKLEGSPEGRYAIGRLKTRAKHAEERAPKVAKKRAERKKKGGKTFSDLMHLADRAFSLFIRWRDSWDSISGRVARCCTCRTVYTWDQLQCGHWIRRENWGTRWDDWNAHIQGTCCNYYRGGDEEKHGQIVESIHGKGACDRLRVKAKIFAKKPSEKEVRSVIKDYAQRLQIMDYPGDLSEFFALDGAAVGEPAPGEPLQSPPVSSTLPPLPQENHQ